MAYNLKRLAGYLLGFVLFYAPFALFERLLGYALTDVHQVQTIHSLCLRIPLEHVLDGKVFRYASISVVSTAILLGVAQSLVYAVGCKLGLSWRMQVDKQKCVGCGICAKKCPMEAATVTEKKADISCHNCIVCGVCAHSCPMQAISYRRGGHEE